MMYKNKFREEIERIIYNEDHAPISIVADRIMDMIEEYPFYPEFTEEEYQEDIEIFDNIFDFPEDDDLEELEDFEEDDIFWF